VALHDGAPVYRLNQDGVFYQAVGVEVLLGEPDKLRVSTLSNPAATIPGQRYVYVDVFVAEEEALPDRGGATLLDGAGAKLAELSVRELHPLVNGGRRVRCEVGNPSAPWIKEQLRQVEERR
jgi:hypothetical protein